jgi:hypothetical protein
MSNPPYSQVKYLRRSGSQLKIFAPVSDLKLISQAGVDNLEYNRKDVAIAGGQVVGDEWAEHVVKHRSGIILRTRSEACLGSIYSAPDTFPRPQYTPQVRSMASGRRVCTQSCPRRNQL